MRNRNLSNRAPAFKSCCDDVVVKGTARYIREKWEALSDEAEKAGDRVRAERFKQQAEHFLKLA